MPAIELSGVLKVASCALSAQPQGSDWSVRLQVIEITRDQLDAFCGNVIEVRGFCNQPILALSTAAHNGFTQDQRAELLRHFRFLCHAPFDTIEHIGGGSVRCAIAELF